MFSALNLSGIIPNFEVGDVSPDITNDTLLIYQDIFVGPDGNINVSVSSNLNGLFDTNLVNDIPNSSDAQNQPISTTEGSFGVKPITSTEGISGTQDELITQSPVETWEVENITRPWLLSDVINLNTVSDTDLQLIIRQNMPHVGEDMLDRISELLKLHGGTFKISMLDDILRNLDVSSTTIVNGSQDVEDKTTTHSPEVGTEVLTEKIIETTSKSEIEETKTSTSRSNNQIDVNLSATEVFTQVTPELNANSVSGTTTSIMEEKPCF